MTSQDGANTQSDAMLNSPPQRLRTIVAWLIGAVFIAAALAKASNPALLNESMKYLFAWSPGSGMTQGLIAALVVVEIGVGALLLSGWRPRLSAGLTGVLLVALSAALVKLALDPAAPACGCAGSLALSGDVQTANVYGLARNGLLLASCAWLVAPV